MKSLFVDSTICAAIWSHPARGAWIEINPDTWSNYIDASHPARGAWIEMGASAQDAAGCVVAPRKGCVD